MPDGIQGTAIAPVTVVREDDAARHLKLSIGFLRKARRESYGPVYLRFGRAVRYRVADLDAWVNACAVGYADTGGHRG